MPALVRRLNNALLRPDLGEARRSAQVIDQRFPGELLAYNCSPSFNWRKHLEDGEIASFREQLGALGYRFQSSRSPDSTR